MAWVRLHDGALSHPKIGGMVDLSHPFDLWVWGLTHCQMHLTDGLIVRDLVPAHALLAVAELLHRRLWEAHDLGWKVHDYLNWNDCREVVHERQAKAKERKEAWKGKQRQGHGTRSGRVKNMIAAIVQPNQTKPNLPSKEHSEEKTGAETSSALPAPARGLIEARAGALRGPIEARSAEDLRFPVIGPAGPEWALSEAQVAEWVRLFPGLDVHGECRKALAWTLANTGRRKTASGMPRFLVRWLSRAVDRGGTSMPVSVAQPLANKRVAGLLAGGEAFLRRGQFPV